MATAFDRLFDTSKALNATATKPPPDAQHKTTAHHHCQSDGLKGARWSTATPAATSTTYWLRSNSPKPTCSTTAAATPTATVVVEVGFREFERSQYVVNVAACVAVDQRAPLQFV